MIDARVIPLRRPREPLWRHVVGDVLRRERTAQQRTLRDVADVARISVAYLSELERGRKKASSEVLAAASRALGLGLADLVDAAREHLAHPDVRAPVLAPQRCDPPRPAPHGGQPIGVGQQHQVLDLAA